MHSTRNQESTGAPDHSAEDSGYLSTARRNYILFILTLVGTVNFLDRQILNILIEPIRKELSLSDTQIGFLVGIVFTFVYVTLGIPAARLADSWSRRKVRPGQIVCFSDLSLTRSADMRAGDLICSRSNAGMFTLIRSERRWLPVL